MFNMLDISVFWTYKVFIYLKIKSLMKINIIFIRKIIFIFHKIKANKNILTLKQ